MRLNLRRIVMQAHLYDLRAELSQSFKASKALSKSFFRMSKLFFKMMGDLFSLFFKEPVLYRKLDPGRNEKVDKNVDFLGMHPPSMYRHF